MSVKTWQEFFYFKKYLIEFCIKLNVSAKRAFKSKGDKNKNNEYFSKLNTKLKISKKQVYTCTCKFYNVGSKKYFFTIKNKNAFDSENGKFLWELAS